MEDTDILIIGGGLSGLYAAYLLSQQKKSFTLLEARSRVGGRILSTEYKGYFSDMGPSWYWPEINPKWVRLAQTLGLEGHRQFENGLGRFQYMDGSVASVRGYTTMPASWRISGGMGSMVKKLLKYIPEQAIRLHHPVCEIKQESSGAMVSVGELEKEIRVRFKARKIILALPPRLAAATILFTPDLSFQLTQAMLGTATWMAGQAKFYALYEDPFWRQYGFSGQAFSQKGPLSEIHDGSSNKSRGPYGLTGFVSIPAAQRHSEQKLIEAILFQLSSIFGKPAGQPLSFHYQDWAREPYTATQFDQPPMREHPDYHPPAGQTAIWDGTLHFAGSETADQHGGYLEGALSSGERAVTNLQ
jgi:monoamine oxidase